MRVVGHVGSDGLEPVERAVKLGVDVVLPPEPALRLRGDDLGPGQEGVGKEPVGTGQVRCVPQDPRVARTSPLTPDEWGDRRDSRREARTRRRLHVLEELGKTQ